MADSVPDTNTFSLTDVTSVVGGDDLVECFANASSSGFDSAYSGNKDSLYNFRNYSNINLSSYLFHVFEHREASNATVAVDQASLHAGTIDKSNGQIDFLQSSHIGGYSVKITGDLDGYIGQSAGDIFNYSISLWVLRTSTRSYDEYLFSLGGDKLFVRWPGSPYSEYTFQLHLETESTTDHVISDTFTADWNHFVITRSSNGFKVYANGTLIHTWNTYLNDISNAKFYTGIIGSDHNYLGYYDQSAMWTRELTATEISYLYNSGNGRVYTNW